MVDIVENGGVGLRWRNVSRPFGKTRPLPSMARVWRTRLNRAAGAIGFTRSAQQTFSVAEDKVEELGIAMLGIEVKANKSLMG